MRNPLLSDLRREHRAKPVPPKSDGLMADVDPALGEEILDVSQRQWVPDAHHYDQTNHFWRTVEISEWAAHGPELPRSEAARRIALTPPRRRQRANTGHSPTAGDRDKSTSLGRSRHGRNALNSGHRDCRKPFCTTMPARLRRSLGRFALKERSSVTVLEIVCRDPDRDGRARRLGSNRSQGKCRRNL